LNAGLSQPAKGTTNWSVQVALAPGPNLIRMHSVDLAGNVSRETTRTFTYVVNVPLTVQTNGLGIVAPDLNGAQLEIGRTYRVRAVPGPGQLFTGWDGMPWQSPVLTFVMQSNLTLVANFVPNPFLTVRGTYAGLVANTNGITPGSSGYFALAVTAGGRFSGRLLLGAARHGFQGQFNLAGDAAVNVPRALAGPLNVVLHIDLTNGTDQATGSVADGNFVSEMAGDRNIFNAQLNPATQAGLRSFILERTDASGTAAAGSSRISRSGAASVRGKLGDGRVFGTASTLAKSGDYPFYLTLNGGSEVVIGWLKFPAGPVTGPSGRLLWLKTGTNAFTATLQAASAQP